MIPRPTSPSAHSRVRPRGSFRLTLQTLEDRTTPAGASWAMVADPEGFVFHDINGNSTFDASESAVGAGWTVYVDDNDNALLDAGEINTATDAAGHYNIFLPDGTYSIKVVPQGSFQTDARPLGTLVRDFASMESGSAGGHNLNSGLAWVNDSLYATLTRNLDNASDNVMYQVDHETGTALGPAVPLPGDISEITFDGTDFWGADYHNDVLIRFNFAGQELQRLSFAGMDIISVEWDGAALRVLDLAARRVYQIDPAGNGTILGFINSPNEAVVGLAFDGTSLWVNGRDTDRVYALDPATGAVQRSFAAPDDLAFGLAVHGQYLWLADNSVSRVFQYDLGYGGGRIVTVAGADVTGVNLAVFQPAFVSGRVFNDNNQNGVQEVNDAGLIGWRVYLDANGNAQYDGWESSAIADGNGNYTVGGLRPGSYALREDLATQLLAMPHWQQTSPAGGAFAPLIISSGDLLAGRNFANHLDRVDPLATDWADLDGGKKNLYTGLVWFDETSAGAGQGSWPYVMGYAADSTRNGYTDWRLSTKNEALAAAVDQRAGDTDLIGLPQGLGIWTSTTSANKAWSVTLNDPAGWAELSVKTLSNHFIATVRDSATVIDDGTAGYADTGWTSKSGSSAYGGKYRQKAAGTGSQTATWTFAGLEPGASYKVVTSWQALSANASNAPYTVLDNTTPLGTVAVNQKVAANDFEISGQLWEGIGTYTTASGTLKVQLSNQANGTVIADAVRIFRVYPSYASGSPLTAAGGAAAGTNAAPLSREGLQPIVREAIRRWNLSDLTAADRTLLKNVHFGIADLDGATLGLAVGNTVTLDRNAAGHGWFVDPTPRSDAEFKRPGDQGEQGKMDLLTTVMHEMGHILGRDHEQSGIMAETLATGTRESIVPGVHIGRGLPTAPPSWFLSHGRSRR